METYQINFSTYILAMQQEAMIHLGKIANPMTGKVEENLTIAKYQIDILNILAEKTKGNLTDEENKVLTSTLSVLQLNYADAMKGKNTE